MRSLRAPTVLVASLMCALFSSTAWCADDAATKTIARGVKYLKGLHQPTAEYTGGPHGIGTASLAGLALLECGVPADDPALKNITALIRATALNQTRTYETSLAIMYLDRLGDKIDRPAIQFLAVRLMAGQSRQGGWSYDCGYALNEAEAARMRKVFYAGAQPAPKDNSDLNPPTQRPRNDLPADPKPPPTEPKAKPPAKSEEPREQLHPEVVRFARWVSTNPNAAASVIGIGGDNSNTQFAVLALWVARKHGVQCDAALGAVEKYFRASQGKDGGWGYGTLAVSMSTPPMTCAGLLALAVGRGIRGQRDGDNAIADRATAAGLKYLETAIANGNRRPMVPPFGLPVGGILKNNLYFLWSLERVAMIFDLDKIGSVDWYNWGSEYLINTQDEDGSWTGSVYMGSSAEVSTPFALLFLTRANLARDLTSTLKGRNRDSSKLTTDRAKNDLPRIEPKQTGPSSSEFETEANRLCSSLVAADASKRASVLTQLRDAKGSVYTEGLVRAIARLQGEQQREAREALAMRLKRMTAVTLRDMLKDENREIRMAAASACSLKEDKQYVPDLIAALGDLDGLVVQSARTSLRNLSQKDFGPSADASASDKANAAAAWKAWWASQSK